MKRLHCIICDSCNVVITDGSTISPAIQFVDEGQTFHYCLEKKCFEVAKKSVIRQAKRNEKTKKS